MDREEKGQGLRILFLVKGNIERNSPSAMNGDCLPGERYWGLELLRKKEKFQLTPWPIAEKRLSIIQRISDCFFPTSKMFGCRASRPLMRRLRVAQEDYDMVLSFNHVSTASLLALRQEEKFRLPIIFLAIGIADWLEKATPSERSHTLRFLAEASRLMVMSQAEAEFFKAMGLNQTVLLPFGVDIDYWSPTKEPVDDYVFAVGSDPCRDFDTLIKACPYPLRIMTRNRHLITVPVLSNVSFVQGDTNELRRLYTHARLVVVPLKDRMQPSGQNTVMQAMAMAKPVILTRTRGIWSDQLYDGENCLIVQPEDSQGLKKALRALYDNPTFAQTLGLRARETVQHHFDAQYLGDALFEIVNQVVNDERQRS